MYKREKTRKLMETDYLLSVFAEEKMGATRLSL